MFDPFLNARRTHAATCKAEAMDPPKASSMHPAIVPAKRCQPPSSSTFARPEASTSAAGVAAAAAASASTKHLKKKIASANDDSVAARLQPKLSQTSWRRTKSYQHVDLSGPTKRTVLEWLPREVVFMVLHLLSFRDIQSLLRADKRIRPLIHAKTFCPWRKLLASFLHYERQYDETIALEEESIFNTSDCGDDHDSDDDQDAPQAAGQHAPQNGQDSNVPPRPVNADQEQIEQNFLQAYTDVVTQLQLKAAPTGLLELVPCLTRLWHEHPSFPLIRKWSRDFLIGRVTSDHIFAAQERFVRRDVRPGELIKVQAFAGTGKTRSLLAYAERRPNKRFLYIAFNKAAADEARRRFPDHVQCRTMHSVALCQVVRTAGQDIGDLRARDVVRLLGESLPEGQLIRAQAIATQTGRDHRLTPTAVATYVLTTLQRFFYSDDTTIIPDRHVPTKVATDTDLKIRAVARCAQDLWDFIRQGSPDRNGKSVKCPHDAYVKLLQLQAPHHSENFFKAFDVLLLDEAQDLSAAQVSILLRAKKHCGILIVGDVFQKIYGFRGGTAKAFNERLYPSSAHFQLTKSFRFGDSVAKIATEMLGLRKPAAWEKAMAKPKLSGALGEADRVFADASVFRSLIEAPSSEQAPATQQQGPAPTQAADEAAAAITLANGLGEGQQAVAAQVSISRMGHTSSLMCHTRIFRSNRKLCLTALALSASLHQPHKIFLKTSQSLQPDAIVTLLRDAHILYHNDSRSMSRNSLLRDFASWKDLVQRVEAEGGGESKLSLAVALGPFLASNDFLDQVKQLETRFAPLEEEATVVLTTVHQAKGLEWDNVVVDDDFRPVFGNDKTQRVEVAGYWHQNELNHLYVALTRAKKRLVVSKVVLQWIAALRGLFRYRFVTGGDKEGICPCCKASKHGLVVKEYRVAVLDFLNPFNTSEEVKAREPDPSPLKQVLGCTGCLTDSDSAIFVDISADPDLATFVQTAPKISRQRPHPPKQAQSEAAVEGQEEKKPKVTNGDAAGAGKFRVDSAKHPLLKPDHRSMKWAIMHHEYKRAVGGWFCE
ncbi:hypothetical protein NDA15_004229 [Ustilago hordei]|nr:hypothetical protein NDA15_004229 [Ustilago hordei]